MNDNTHTMRTDSLDNIIVSEGSTWETDVQALVNAIDAVMRERGGSAGYLNHDRGEFEIEGPLSYEEAEAVFSDVFDERVGDWAGEIAKLVD